MPSADEAIPAGGVVVLYTEDDSEPEKVTVPDFTGLSVSEVNRLANKTGINVVFSGPTETAGIKAFRQSVAADTQADAGTKITVYFRGEDIAED